MSSSRRLNKARLDSTHLVAQSDRSPRMYCCTVDLKSGDSGGSGDLKRSLHMFEKASDSARMTVE